MSGPIVEDKRRQIAKLVRMFSSDVDGEVLGAARAVVRVLAGEHLSIHDLATHIEAPDRQSAVHIIYRDLVPAPKVEIWHDLPVKRQRAWLDAIAAASWPSAK